MDTRPRLREFLPYFIILVIFALAAGLGAPAWVRQAQAEAQALGQPFNPLPIIAGGFALAGAGLLAGFIVDLQAHRAYRMAILRLSDAAEGLGKGQFDLEGIPEAESLPEELAGVGDALRNAAEQIQKQIAELSDERAMLSTVLSQMTDGLLIADETGRVRLLNKMAEKLFRISQEKAIGRSIVEVMRHHALVELWENVSRGKSESVTLEMGSNHTYLQVIGLPLAGIQPRRTMFLFQDLTQTHRLEVVRQDFISNISHELRTPMASLKALSETLLDGALDDPPAARRFVVRMDTEVDNLTQLVNELLELSRIESGRTNFEFQRVAPCELEGKACERMSLQAERVGLTFGQDCGENLPLIIADPDRISQVLLNLIHNAIKFTPSGGHIQVSAWQDGDKVVFRVADSGVGISPGEINRIFERFYKADRARAGGGTGLGLSISRHMVEAHGGKIWAESEEDSGSRFFFTIPVAPS